MRVNLRSLVCEAANHGSGQTAIVQVGRYNFAVVHGDSNILVLTSDTAQHTRIMVSLQQFIAALQSFAAPIPTCIQRVEDSLGQKRWIIKVVLTSEPAQAIIHLVLVTDTGKAIEPFFFRDPKTALAHAAEIMELISGRATVDWTQIEVKDMVLL